MFLLRQTITLKAHKALGVAQDFLTYVTCENSLVGIEKDVYLLQVHASLR